MQYATQLTIRNSLKICNSWRNGDFRVEVDRPGSFYSTSSAGRFSDLLARVELKVLGLGFNVRFFLHLHAHLKILITLRLQNTLRSTFYHVCRQIASIFIFIYRAELLVTRAKRRRLVKKASACQTFHLIAASWAPRARETKPTLRTEK